MQDRCITDMLLNNRTAIFLCILFHPSLFGNNQILQEKYFLPFFVFFKTTSPPHIGHGIPTFSKCGFVFLHSGNPGHARNFPYGPYFTTIFLPHSSQITSVTSSSILIFSNLFLHSSLRSQSLGRSFQ